MWEIFRCTFGIFIGMLWIIIWKQIPETWLCDYGQTVDKSHKQEKIPRGLVILVMVILFVFSFLIPCGKIDYCFLFVLKMSFVWILLQIAVTDFYYQIIPDQWVIANIIISFLQFVVNNEVKMIGSVLLSVFLLTLFLWVFAFFLSFLFKQEVLGFGDIKLFFSLGLYFGFSGVLWILTWSMIFCGVGCTILLLFKVYQKDSTCAYAPYIVTASYILLLYHPI
ncbi:prepilin peptidase [Anaerovorax sp. IOR16]|uniref:prepilin peptidase n=1 Tax=Anaerovorax sp. IOR16 TaxID=2773458 RepID=UPI0019D11B9B|nr:A24 family peptidase [Anaerovorax sp. IOR16]